MKTSFTTFSIAGALVLVMLSSACAARPGTIVTSHRRGSSAKYGNSYGSRYKERYSPRIKYRAPKPSGYRDNGDGSITDLRTGLVWQKVPSHHVHTWTDAHKYAEHLKVGGHRDWRVPTLSELSNFKGYSVLTCQERYDTGKRSNRGRVASEFWSSELSRRQGKIVAYSYDLSTGITTAYPVGDSRRFSQENYVLCVRNPRRELAKYDGGQGRGKKKSSSDWEFRFGIKLPDIVIRR